MDRFERLPDMACEVTPELKQRIRDVNREAHALHLAVFPTVYVGAKTTDFEGNVLSSKEYKANSFNRNYWNTIAYLLTGTKSGETTFGEGNINLRYGNTSYYAFGSTYLSYFYPIFSNSTSYGFSFAASGGHGICIGTSNAAEDFDGYELGSKIASGTGAGQMTALSPTPDTTVNYDTVEKVYTSTLSRIFKNTSGGSITVAETGIILGNGSAPYLVERTLLPESKPVPTGSQIEVTYTFEFVYPEPA